MAKFYMLSAAVSNGHVFWLVIFGVVCAAISAYYYFRVIQAMYFKEGVDQQIDVSIGFKALLIGMALVVILLGIFPNLLIDRLYIIYL